MSETEGLGRNFSMRDAAERRLFYSEKAAGFFVNKWCDINDSIEPLIVAREVWEERQEKGILQPGADGKKELYIPRDVHVWEMLAIAEAIDRDTFVNNPHLAEVKREEYRQLGELFINSGVYFAQHLKLIPPDAGKDIAELYAKEFFAYGRSLIQQEDFDTEDLTIQGIAYYRDLTPEQTEQVDRWLAGDEVYNNRKARALKFIEYNKNEHDVDVSFEHAMSLQRKNALRQFFSVAKAAAAAEAKAFNENHYANIPVDMEPEFASGGFLKRVKQRIQKSVLVPETEFDDAFYRRGMTLLTENVGETGYELTADNFQSAIDYSLQPDRRKLIEVLKIDDLKAELDQVRETHDIAAIAKKEKAIALKIQVAVSTYGWESHANNPSEMLKTRVLNCVGHSMLGCGLLDRVGIKSLALDLPGHSATILITSDNKAYWQDMQSTGGNREITDDDITVEPNGIVDPRTNLHRKAVTVADLVAASSNPQSEPVNFFIKSDKLQKNLSWIDVDQRDTAEISVGHPHTMLKSTILSNTGIELYNATRYEQAEIFLRKAIDLTPNQSRLHQMLGLLYDIDKDQGMAITEYLKAIRENPYNTRAYRLLAGIYERQNDKEHADQLRDRAVDMGDKNRKNIEDAAKRADWKQNNERSAMLYQRLYDLVDPSDVRERARISAEMGRQLSMLHRHDEAIAKYEEALSGMPGSVHTHINLGYSLIQTGNLDSAQEHLEYALKNLDPVKNQAEYNIAKGNLDRVNRLRNAGKQP